MKSLSEIETTSKRASKAAGFSWGISEEIGKGVRLLELFNLKGIKSLNEYLKLKLKKSFENLNLINKNNQIDQFPYCPIILGVSFLDQIKNLEEFDKIKFSKIAYPLLFLPFLSRASELIGKRILLKFDNKEFILNFNVNILSKLIKNDCPILAKNVEVSFIENIDNFSKQDWSNLYKLSEETFVEETESLKKVAAGAGLTDND
tara:strand:- start:168 stop:779 length:612 start_codon:yes stop_codon:yes gene_type:complete